MAAPPDERVGLDPFQYLPSELTLQILSYFHFKELFTLMQVSRAWDQMASTPSLFRQLGIGCSKAEHLTSDVVECEANPIASKLVAKARGELREIFITAHHLDQAQEFLELVTAARNGGKLERLAIGTPAVNLGSPLVMSCLSACNETLRSLHVHGFDLDFAHDKGFFEIVNLTLLSLKRCGLFGLMPLPPSLEYLEVENCYLEFKTKFSWSDSDLPNLRYLQWWTHDPYYGLPVILGTTDPTEITVNQQGLQIRESAVHDLKVVINWNNIEFSSEIMNQLRVFANDIGDAMESILAAYGGALTSCTIGLIILTPHVLDIIAQKLTNIKELSLLTARGVESSLLRGFANRLYEVHGKDAASLVLKTGVILDGQDLEDDDLIPDDSTPRPTLHQHCARRKLFILDDKITVMATCPPNGDEEQEYDDDMPGF